MIMLEEGKFYKTRDGQKIGPLTGTTFKWVAGHGERSDPEWENDGRGTNAEDIVEEWVDPVEEPCPAQVAVEGNPTPEPFTHGDVIPGMAFSAPPIDVKDFYSKPCPSCGATGDFHWSHCTAIVSHSEPVKAQPDIKVEIADTAKRIVSGARRAAYGRPEQNFERIARFWQSYFENTGRAEAKITAADVSPLMRLMKEARLCETPDHKDSFIDIVGYTLTGAEVNQVAPEPLTSSV